MNQGPAQPRRRPRHLMDPDNPVRRSDPMTLGQVQKWILSILATTTILHLAGGFAVAALVEERFSSQVGLLVIAAITGVLALVAGFAIHGRRLLSWWLVLGLLPAAVAARWVFAG